MIFHKKEEKMPGPYPRYLDTAEGFREFSFFMNLRIAFGFLGVPVITVGYVLAEGRSLGGMIFVGLLTLAVLIGLAAVVFRFNLGGRLFRLLGLAPRP
jgi:hypothetical protein